MITSEQIVHLPHEAVFITSSTSDAIDITTRCKRGDVAVISHDRVQNPDEFSTWILRHFLTRTIHVEDRLTLKVEIISIIRRHNDRIATAKSCDVKITDGSAAFSEACIYQYLKGQCDADVVLRDIARYIGGQLKEVFDAFDRG